MNADYDYLIKVIVTGESGCGKSSLLQQFVDKVYMETFISTIGVDFKFKNITLESGKVAKLQLWDTAGQERFKSIVSSYWRNADAVMFIFDVTDPKSFASVRRWAEDVNRQGKPSVQKILVGNKTDLTSHRVITYEMGANLARELSTDACPVKYFETSAKTAVNVNEAFTSIAETTAANYQRVHGIQTEVLDVSGKKKKKLQGTPVDAEQSITCCSVM